MCPPRIIPKDPGAVEVAAGRQLRDGLLAGIDQVRVLLPLIGEGAEAEHAVLALQLHGHAVGHVVRHQRRDADAEVHVEAVLQLAAARAAISSRVQGMGRVLLR
jgi:hypothetical protein